MEGPQQIIRRRSRSLSPIPKNLKKSRLGHADHCRGRAKVTIPTLRRLRSRSESGGGFNDPQHAAPCHSSDDSCEERDVWAKAYEFGDLIVRLSKIWNPQAGQDCIRPISDAEELARALDGSVNQDGVPVTAPAFKGAPDMTDKIVPKTIALPPPSFSPGMERLGPSSDAGGHRNHSSTPISSSVSNAINTPSDMSLDNETEADVDQYRSSQDECSESSGSQGSFSDSEDDSLQKDLPMKMVPESQSHRSPAYYQSGRRPNITPGPQFLNNGLTAAPNSCGFNHGHGGNGNDDDRHEFTRENKKRKRAERRFHCVFCNSGRRDETTDCSTLKQYVSQLKRHHDRHSFYYCTTCFSTFPSQTERQQHCIGNVCFSKCVAENCPNYDQSPAMLGDDAVPCGHGKDSPLRDQWRYLFRLARPNEPVPEPEIRQLYLPSFLPLTQTAGSDRGSHETSLPSTQVQPTVSPFLPENDLLEQQPAITKLAQASSRLTELARSLEQYADVLDMDSQKAIERILDHTSLNLRHLEQVNDTFARPQPWPQAEEGKAQSFRTGQTPSNEQGVTFMPTHSEQSQPSDNDIYLNDTSTARQHHPHGSNAEISVPSSVPYGQFRYVREENVAIPFHRQM